MSDADFLRDELEWQKQQYDLLVKRYRRLEEKYLKLITLQRTAIEFKKAVEDVEGDQVHVPFVQS